MFWKQLKLKKHCMIKTHLKSCCCYSLRSPTLKIPNYFSWFLVSIDSNRHMISFSNTSDFAALQNHRPQVNKSRDWVSQFSFKSRILNLMSKITFLVNCKHVRAWEKQLSGDKLKISNSQSLTAIPLHHFCLLGEDMEYQRKFIYSLACKTKQQHTLHLLHLSFICYYKMKCRKVQKTS